MKKSIKISIITFLICTFISLSFSAIPKLISYQGILTDALGQPKADGAYELTFKLYNVPTEGNNIWSETKTVQLKNGVFTATLGSDSALSLPFDTTYYLGISLASGVEYAPRIQLTSSGYAIRASVSDSATSAYHSVLSFVADSSVKSYSSVVATSAGTATVADSARAAHYADTTLKAASAAQATVATTATSIPVTAIAANSIDSTKLAVSSVGSAEIADGAIATADVAATFKAPYADSADTAGYATLAGTVLGTSISGKIVTDTVNLIGTSPQLNISDTSATDLYNGIIVKGTGAALTLHSYALQVNRDNATDVDLSIGINSNNDSAFTGNGGGIVFGTNDGSGYSTKMKVSKDGKVGIGTSSPTTDLEVVDSTQTSLVKIKTNSDSSFADLMLETDNTNSQIFALGSNYSGSTNFGGPGSLNLYNQNDNPITFYQGNKERMRIASSGNVGIGTKTPRANLTVSTEAKGEHVGSDDAEVSSGLILEGNGPRTVGVGPSLTFRCAANAAGSLWDHARILGTPSDNSENQAYGRLYLQVRDAYDPGAGGYWNWRTGLMIRSNGNVGIGTNNPSEKLTVDGNVLATNVAVSSDIRYKKNISQIENAIDKVQKIDGCYYDWKKEDFPKKSFSDKRQVGVIAQVVEKVLPEVVKTDDKGYKSVSYDKLTALLIEAVKEQQKQIDELKKEVSNLKKDK